MNNRKQFAHKSAIILLLILTVFSCINYAAEKKSTINQKGELQYLKLANAPFPHPKRSKGYTSKGIYYSYSKHYNDNTVAVYIPETLKKNHTGESPVNFVIYFHGWYNNVDKTIEEFRLIKQFERSNRNAILIFPEGPKNAPDSFAGKMEDKNGFKQLINEVSKTLEKQGTLGKITPGSIVICGHSGAYKAIANIIKKGGLTEHIKEVYLFDGLYNNQETFKKWIKTHKTRFINIYTQKCTKRKSEYFKKELELEGVQLKKIHENDLTIEDLSKHRIIFIESPNKHEEVVHINSNLYRFLSSGKI
ncbi:MAG: hypothetical protein GY754_24770 [bacterium]|nr:hypothetical protein [bacterium]